MDFQPMDEQLPAGFKLEPIIVFRLGQLFNQGVPTTIGKYLNRSPVNDQFQRKKSHYPGRSC